MGERVQFWAVVVGGIIVPLIIIAVVVTRWGILAAACSKGPVLEAAWIAETLPFDIEIHVRLLAKISPNGKAAAKYTYAKLTDADRHKRFVDMEGLGVFGRLDLPSHKAFKKVAKPHPKPKPAK